MKEVFLLLIFSLSFSVLSGRLNVEAQVTGGGDEMLGGPRLNYYKDDDPFNLDPNSKELIGTYSQEIVLESMNTRSKILLSHFQAKWEKCFGQPSPSLTNFSELYQNLVILKFVKAIPELNQPATTNTSACNIPIKPDQSLCLLSSFEDRNLLDIYLQNEDFRLVLIHKNNIPEAQSDEVIKFLKNWVIQAKSNELPK